MTANMKSALLAACMAYVAIVVAGAPKTINQANVRADLALGESVLGKGIAEWKLHNPHSVERICTEWTKPSAPATGVSSWLAYKVLQAIDGARKLENYLLANLLVTIGPKYLETAAAKGSKESNEAYEARVRKSQDDKEKFYNVLLAEIVLLMCKKEGKEIKDPAAVNAIAVYASSGEIIPTA